MMSAGRRLENDPITTHPLSVGGGAARGEHRALSLRETMRLDFFHKTKNYGSSKNNQYYLPFAVTQVSSPLGIFTWDKKSRA